jgi:hypothetical protein
MGFSGHSYRVEEFNYITFLHFQKEESVNVKYNFLIFRIENIFPCVEQPTSGDLFVKYSDTFYATYTDFILIQGAAYFLSLLKFFDYRPHEF